MAAATEKRRGRPRKYTKYEDPFSVWHINSEIRSGRNLQNYVNAYEALNAIYGLATDAEDEEAEEMYTALGEEFIYRHDNEDEHNHLRYQGVLEQIGRMHRAGLISDVEVSEFAVGALAMIKSGHTSREVERELRNYRLSVAATKKE